MQNDGSRITKMGDKVHMKADTFFTLKCSNKCFFLKVIYFIDNCLHCAGHVEEALDVKTNASKKKLNRSTGELKVEKDYLNNLKERQRGYHKCLQGGCTFKRKTSRRVCTYSTSICKLPTVLYLKILKLVEKDTD